MKKAFSVVILSVAFLVGCSSDDKTNPGGVVLNGGESSSGGGTPLKVTPEAVRSYIESIRTSFSNTDETDPKLRLLFFRPFKRVADLQAKNAASNYLKFKFETVKVSNPQIVFTNFYQNIVGTEIVFPEDSNDQFSLYQQINISKLRQDLRDVTWIYGDCSHIHSLPEHKQASFFKNSEGAVLCFDPEKLSDLSPDTYKNQIMTLFLHELGHMYGFSEEECVVLQRIFFWNFETEKASSMHQVRLFDLISKVAINPAKWCSSDNFMQTFSDINLFNVYSNLVAYPLSVEATVDEGTMLEQEVVFLLQVIESYILDPNKFKNTFCGDGKEAEFEKIHYHLNLLRSYLLGDSEEP